MAALGGDERECRTIFIDCLLNTEVSNSYTMDEFKDFFPRKYRDHQDIKTLYDVFQTKRKQLRDTVLMNIRLHCRQREELGQKLRQREVVLEKRAVKISEDFPQDNEVTDDRYKSDIEELEAREQILQEEIDAMKQDIDRVEESIGSCADTLEKKRIFSDLESTDFDTRKLRKTRTSRSNSKR